MSAMYQPLADRLRPNSIDEVVGQRHILGEQGFCGGSFRGEISPI